MQNGLAIIEKTDTETKGFYIDQDALEFARMNARTDKRISKAEAANREANRQCRNAEKMAARRKAYTLKTIGYILTNCAVCGAVAWAGMAGMIHPIISIPVSIFCLCVACVRFGSWFGRVTKK
jgi:hypothetical protein